MNKPKTWMNGFTVGEIHKFSDALKRCPRCGLIGKVIDDFGLRRRKIPHDPARKRITARDHCFSCQARLSAERLKRNPEKWQRSLDRLKELDKRKDVLEAKKKYRKVWLKRKRDKVNAASKRHKEKNPKKHLARLIAKAAYPEPQQCSIKGCKKQGVRHHEDYSKPLEIVWLCIKHHAERHREIRKDKTHVHNRSQQSY